MRGRKAHFWSLPAKESFSGLVTLKMLFSPKLITCHAAATALH